MTLVCEKIAESRDMFHVVAFRSQSREKGNQIIVDGFGPDSQITGVEIAATFYLANTNDTVTADEVIPYGSGSWMPAAGNFN